MNFVAFGFLLICCHAWAIEIGDYYRYATDNKIVSLLEDLKTKLKTGDDEWGIPVLDPFTSAQESINIKEEIITLDALLTNINVQGISEYDVIDGDFSLAGLKLAMNLSWPRIEARTNYAMNGIVADSFEISGNGSINAIPYKLNFGMEVAFGQKGGHFNVKNLQSKVSLEELDFKITGLLDDDEFSELMSSLVSDIVPQIIEDYQEDITSTLNAVIKEQLDAFLSTKTIMEIIKIIT